MRWLDVCKKRQKGRFTLVKVDSRYTGLEIASQITREENLSYWKKGNSILR